MFRCGSSEMRRAMPPFYNGATRHGMRHCSGDLSQCAISKCVQYPARLDRAIYITIVRSTDQCPTRWQLLPVANEALGADVRLARWLAVRGKNVPRQQVQRFYVLRGTNSITGMVRAVFC